MKFSKGLFLLTLALTPISAPLIATNQFSSSRQAFIKGLFNTNNIIPGIAAGALILPAMYGTTFVPRIKNLSGKYQKVLDGALFLGITGLTTALDQNLKSSENTDTSHQTAHCLGRRVGTGAVAATTLVAIAVFLDKILPHL